MKNASQGNRTALPLSGIAAIMQDLGVYFDQCDNDHDGRISFNEFILLLKYLGGWPAQRDWHAEFESIEMNGRTSIDIQGFFKWWMK